MTPPVLTPRQRFLKQRQRRQNFVFAVTGAVLLALALLSLLVLTGLVPVPFANEFSKTTKHATAGTIPCPAEGALPVDPSTITVQVLNTTSRQGLAGEATNVLVTAGYSPLEAGNASPEYAGVVEIDAGPAAVNEAYTVARFFPKSKVVLTEATDKTVTVLLGTFYDSSVAADELARIAESREPLKAPAGCLALSEEDLEKAGSSASQSASEEGQSGATAQSGS